MRRSRASMVSVAAVFCQECYLDVKYFFPFLFSPFLHHLFSTPQPICLVLSRKYRGLWKLVWSWKYSQILFALNMFHPPHSSYMQTCAIPTKQLMIHDRLLRFGLAAKLFCLELLLRCWGELWHQISTLETKRLSPGRSLMLFWVLRQRGSVEGKALVLSSIEGEGEDSKDRIVIAIWGCECRGRLRTGGTLAMKLEFCFPSGLLTSNQKFRLNYGKPSGKMGIAYSSTW